NGVTADVGVQITLASGALLTLNADGTFDYDPNGQFDNLNAGQSAQDSFTYTIDDGNGGTAVGTVNINVSGSIATSDAVVLGDDGILRVDADRLTVDSIDLSSFDVDAVFTSLGNLTQIGTAAGQSIELDGAQLDVISEADGTLTISGGGAVNVVNAGLTVSADGSQAPSVLNLLALEFEGLAAQKSLIPDNLTVDGSATDAFTAFWIQLDQKYVGSGDYYDVNINTAFVYIGNDYADYLKAGGEALLDLVKVPDGRIQTLHDNLLGNLGDGPIASRFTNQGLEDPRTETGAEFGGRPYHAGYVDENGEYSNLTAVSGVIAWDIANGVGYPDDLPGPYGVLDGDNVISGTSGDDFLFGGDGDDTLNGGAGEDSAVYEGSQLDFAVSTNAETLALSVDDTDGSDGDEGTDALTGVETLQFDDGTLRFEAAIARAADEQPRADQPADTADGFHAGTGLANTNFLVSDNTDVGIEAALKIHNRFAGDVETDGTIYHTNTGTSGADIGLWNFDYSVIDYGATPNISSYNIVITADFIDIHGNRTDDIMTFDAVAHESQQQEDYYQDPSGNTQGLQNSQNIGWYDDGSYDPSAPGTYEVTLTVTDSAGDTVTSTAITVDVAPNITVAADGSGDYLTIQEAITAAEEGNTIFVKAGTYDEDLTIGKQVTLIGAQAGVDGRE
ncbi:MAG: pectinesterase family protein, partial [Rhodospirillales bacterium]|nr:pectinesterase family protein [Rhodospirillales bacterium]